MKKLWSGLILVVQIIGSLIGVVLSLLFVASVYVFMTVLPIAIAGIAIYFLVKYIMLLV